MVFMKLVVQLFSFVANAEFPSQVFFQMDTKIFHGVSLWYVVTIERDWRTSAISEIYMDRFVFIYLKALRLCLFLNWV